MSSYIKPSKPASRAIIAAQHQREARIIAVGLAVRGWIESREGVKLTKRNKPALLAVAAQAWGSSVNFYCQDYVGLAIVSGNYHRSGEECSFRFVLGGGECPVVTVEQFDNSNLWLQAGIDNRQPKREQALASQFPEQLDVLLNEFMAAREALKAALKDCTDSHFLKECLGDAVYNGLENR